MSIRVEGPQSSEEFDKLQKELLRNKYLYYIKDRPAISDYDYDMLEDRSWKMARKLGYKADKWDDPDENEKHHIHHMVDFNFSHPLASEIINAEDSSGYRPVTENAMSTSSEGDSTT